MGILAETMEIEDEGGGKYRVKVRVKHPPMAPQMAYETRARIQALVSAGIVQSVEQGVRDLPKGKIERLTNVQSNRRVSGGSVLITRVIEVVVRKYRDG